MSAANEVEATLVARIRRGDSDAWADLIDRFEGRLRNFVESRLSNKAAAEDIVQEAFLGFLNSLPNYDGHRSLESYLFSICAYKLTDHLRREGRRPAISFSARSESSGQWEFSGHERGASSLVRSVERRRIEEDVLQQTLDDQIARWQERGDWVKLKCIELLIVKGWANKRVAESLDITEQQVANFKFDFIARLRTLIKRRGINEDLFPELCVEES
ncbi:MAG: sigma-70 family RNA polymerase sigma factor [Planctomycetales bacterium]|nr:sigma-70 family RNA polymerase sigma factor [Planctomycetales bacterium]